MPVNGARWIVEALRDQGVGHVFMGLGGLNDEFMDPLTSTDGLRPIVAAFEGGAAYMADGYSRASGGLGVCFAIGGPGILNAATALAAATADRSSVLAISGEVARSWEGLGGFQDASAAAIDDIAALRPITGVSLSVSSRKVLPHHLRQVVSHSLTRHQPTHLSVPVDILRSDISERWTPMGTDLLHPGTLDTTAFGSLVAALGEHDAPGIVILAGAAVQRCGATDELRRFAERFDIPVATTLAGKGLLPETHPLALGVFGYGGSRWAIEAIRSPDVDTLLVIGTGLTQRDTMQWDPAMLPSKCLIHVESDPMQISRTWSADVPVVSDPGVVLRHLDELDGDAAASIAAGAEPRRRFLDGVRRSGPRIYDDDERWSDAEPMHPGRVVTELRNAYPDDGILCVDSGAHRAFFAEYWDVRRHGTHFSLAGMGPMGGAIPLGIGVQVARPGQPVMVGTSDGCMLMHGMELHTAARERLPLIIALLDNRSYGNIWLRASRLGPGPERLTDIEGITWVEFARAMGGDGEMVDDPEQVGDALGRALAAEGPYLLDLRIDKRVPTPVGVWRERLAHWADDD